MSGLDPFAVRRAFAENAIAATDDAEFNTPRVGDDDSFASPGARAAAKEVGLDAMEANELMAECLRASVTGGAEATLADLQEVRYDHTVSALAIGHYFGYLARLRVEDNRVREGAKS